MNKIDAIIVDDEVNNIAFLKSLLQENCPAIKIIETTNRADIGLQMISVLEPQLVFMDIDMPGMTGFELLKKLEPLKFEVIFVTAYNQYALEAFDFNAIGYVTKPIATEKLITAVEKASKKIADQKYTEQIFSLLENVQSKKTGDKVALPTLQGLQFIAVNQIMYCESSGNYTNFFLVNNSKIMVSKQLGVCEKLLPADTFVRIHDKHLINISAIKEYIKGNGGEVVLENGTKLTVSARRKNELLSRFEVWLKKN
jgi:two-component system, LytTR family, response regulator